MKLANSDIHLMRWSLSAICASALLSGGVLYGSNQYAEHQQNNLRTAQGQMNDARKRLTAARQDQESLSVYAIEYGQLENQNIIGDDHRLDWMEGLEKLRNQNLAVDFRYNIAPQKNYVPQPAIDSGNFDIHYSEMKLQFELLHEGQLLKFFDALHNQIKGRYQLEGCAMQRVASDNGTATSTGAKIKAECSGGWITLKNRNTQP
jgi:hypothetical protein